MPKQINILVKSLVKKKKFQNLWSLLYFKPEVYNYEFIALTKGDEIRYSGSHQAFTVCYVRVDVDPKAVSPRPQLICRDTDRALGRVVHWGVINLRVIIDRDFLDPAIGISLPILRMGNKKEGRHKFYTLHLISSVISK